MSLKEILNQIQEAEAEALIDPKQCDPRVKAGVESKIRNAKERIGTLHNQYRNTLLHSIMVINLTGPGAQKFAQIARDKWKILTYDHKEVAKLLVDALLSRGATKEFNSNDGFLLQSELLNLKGAYAMAQLPQLVINEIKPSVYGSGLLPAIERILETSYGPGLYDVHILRLAQGESLKSRFSGNVIPVFLYDYYTDKAEQRILPSPQFTIDVETKTPTVKYVQEHINAIKAKLSPTSKTEETVKETVNS